MQQKTQRPVQFEITPSTREALGAWIKQVKLRSEDYLFPSRIHNSPRMGTRKYARVLEEMGEGYRPRCIRLRYAFDATHQSLPDLSANEELESGTAIAWAHQARSTVRYLGIEVDDALELAEQTEV